MASFAAIIFLLFIFTTSLALTSPKYTRNNESTLSFPIYVLGKFENSSAMFQELIAQDNNRTKYFLNAVRGYNSSNLYQSSSGAFYIRLLVGSERRIVNLLLDTGSDLIWWLKYPCKNCYLPKFVSRYRPERSKSYEPILCDSGECIDTYGAPPEYCAFGDPCEFWQSYLDYNAIKYRLGYEQVYSNSEDHSLELKFGLATATRGAFVEQFHGVLGFGRYHDLSFVQQYGLSSFSFCLTSTINDEQQTGTLYFNHYPQPGNPNTIIVPLLNNIRVKSGYYVEVVGLSIQGKRVPVDPSVWKIDRVGDYGTIVDTGTTITKFPEKVYSIFRESYNKEVIFQRLSERIHEVLDTCYWAPDDVQPEDFPSVSIDFTKRQTLYIPQTQVIVPFNATVYCLAFTITPGQNPVSIIGNLQLRGTRLSFNLDKENSITFGPNEC